MKKIIFLIFSAIFLISSFSLFADDDIVLKPQFSIFQGFEYSGMDMRCAKNDIGDYGTPFYSRTNLKASYGIKKGDFTFTPYVQERLEFFLSKDLLEGGYSNVNVRGRNRIYLGAVFAYSFNGLINLSFNLENMIQNDFKKSKQEDVPTLFRFTPTISLGGEYDFGFKWSLLNTFGLYFSDESIYANHGKISQLYMEGGGDFSFDFLRHIKSDLEHQLMIVGDYDYYYSNTNPYEKGEKRVYSGIMGIGIAYQYKGIRPNFQLKQWHVFDDYIVNIRNNFGLQAGVAFFQERYNVSFTYIGGRQILTKEKEPWQSFLRGTFSVSF